MYLVPSLTCPYSREATATAHPAAAAAAAARVEGQRGNGAVMVSTPRRKANWLVW